MTDQLERIAEPVQLHLECNDFEHNGRQVKRSRVSVSSYKDDVPCESNNPAFL